MIETNLKHIQQKIHALELQLNRPKNSIKLLAASKNQSIEKIKSAYDAGQRLFGENYLQEALTKMKSLEKYDIEWHFIGHIQKNKIKKIAENFAWVQSVDHIEVAEKLNQHRPTQLAQLNICIEVNISQENSKSGVNVDEVYELAKQCMTLPNIKLRGLMTIPSISDSQDDLHQAFKKMHALYEDLIKRNLVLDTLSMGMSEDFEAAICEGSTMVRIGTAIFGSRV